MPDVMSHEDALAFLAPEPAPQTPAPAPEAAAVETPPIESEAAPTAEDAPAPETASEDAPAEPVEAAKPSIDPPHFWDAKDKPRFAKLPSDIQSVILEQSKNGERAVTKAQEEASTARKAAEQAAQKAEAEAQSFADLNKRLGDIVIDKKVAFEKRWEAMLKASPEQIAEYARSNPDEYVAVRAQFDAESAEMQRHEAVKLDAEKKALEAEQTRDQAWRSEQAEKLKTLAPDLTDPKDGQARWQKLTAFGKKFGVEPAVIARADALTLSLAYKAMLYDELTATAKTPVPRQPAPAAPSSRPAPKPAAPPQSSGKALLEKGAKNGRLSNDDALAFLRAQT